MALYELEARFVTESGETLVGHDAIRKVLAGMIAAKTQFRSRVVRAVTVDDIAQLYSDFEGTTVDSSGNTVPVHSKAIEVLHRQPDGGWKLVMGDPNGRRRLRTLGEYNRTGSDKTLSHIVFGSLSGRAA